MRTSLLKTLAAKYKSTLKGMVRKYAAVVEDERGKHKVLQVRVTRPGKPDLVATFGGLPMRWQREVANSDPQWTAMWCRRRELVSRLLAGRCELCGSTERCEVHHIRKLADLHRRGRSKRPWEVAMIGLRRKTLVVCGPCHHDIHNGKYDGHSLTNALESRVQ